MRILVVGGDGYLGWSQALHLTAAGHQVRVLDNLARRQFDLDSGLASLTPIATPDARIRRWNHHCPDLLRFDVLDVTDYAALSGVFAEFEPEAVVHYGEQRSAPYSMIDREHAVHTQTNNVVGTLNLLYAIAEHAPQAHLVKLGTMGEYGTPNIEIEEGFLEVTHKGRTDLLPFPKQPGSFYHLSKVHDSHNIMFCCRAWGLRATDLNQGVVYGAATEHTALHPELATRFDYDHIYGTALNRFCVQAATGRPISVYGRGGQTRGYIDIRDTMRCIELALDNPPAAGEYRVFNQFTDQFSLLQIADMVVTAARDLGITAEIEHVANPRIEAEEHFYRAAHTKLPDLGLVPHHLSEVSVAGLIEHAQRHAERADRGVMAPRISWARPHLVRQDAR